MLLEPVPGRQARAAPDQGRRVARPGVRGRRRARRPQRVRRRAARRPRHASPASSPSASSSTPSPTSCTAGWTPTTAIVVMGEDVHRLNGGTNGATRGLNDAYPDRVLGTPDQRERLRRPRRRHGAGRPVRAGRRVHVRRLHVGRRRPALQPDRQGPAHVRRRRRRAARAAQQGRHGHRLRLAALDGPGRHFRHRRPVADRRAVDPVRLRRPDEQRAALQGPGASCSSTSTSTRRVGEGPADDLDYCLPVGKAAVRREGERRHGHHLPGDDELRARGGRAGRRPTPR